MDPKDIAHSLYRASCGVPMGTAWKHYKGDTVSVVGHCVRESDCTVCVLYMHKLTLWCRPLEEWSQEVIVQGEKVKRFTQVEKQEVILDEAEEC